MSVFARRAAWLTALLAALVLYVFENGAGTRMLLAVFVLLPLLSGLVLCLPQRLSAGLDVPPGGGRRTPLCCVLTLQNSGRLPLFVRCAVETTNLLTGETVRQTVTRAVGPGRTSDVGFWLAPGHCGRLRVRVCDVRAFDPLGLFSRPLPCVAAQETDVLPDLFPLSVTLAETADSLSDSLRYSADRPGYDPSETFRIREYVPGDPVRQIHWKLSGKTDKLLVRELGLPVVDRMLLLLETTSLPGAAVTADGMDRMLDLLFSVSQALLQAGVAHTIGWRETATGAFCPHDVSGPDDLAAVRLQALRNPFAPGGVTAAGCYAGAQALCAYAHIAIAAPYVAPDAPELGRGGSRVSVLLCGDAPDTQSGVFVLPVLPDVLRAGELNLVL